MEPEELSLKAKMQKTPAHTHCFEQHSQMWWHPGQENNHLVFIQLCFFRFLKARNSRKAACRSHCSSSLCSRSKPDFWPLVLLQSLYPKWNNQTIHLHLSKPTHPQKQTSTSWRMELCICTAQVQMAGQPLSKMCCLNQASYPKKASSLTATQECIPTILRMRFYLLPWSLKRESPLQANTALYSHPSPLEINLRSTNMQTEQFKFQILSFSQNQIKLNKSWRP